MEFLQQELSGGSIRTINIIFRSNVQERFLITQSDLWIFFQTGSPAGFLLIWKIATIWFLLVSGLLCSVVFVWGNFVHWPGRILIWRNRCFISDTPYSASRIRTLCRRIPKQCCISVRPKTNGNDRFLCTHRWSRFLQNIKTVIHPLTICCPEHCLLWNRGEWRDILKKF